MKTACRRFVFETRFLATTIAMKQDVLQHAIGAAREKLGGA
jgi:hypothetical protein